MDQFPSRSPFLVKYVQTHVVQLGVTSELRNPRIQPLGKVKLPRALKGHGPLVRARRGIRAGPAGSCKFRGSAILQMLPPVLIQQTQPREGQRERKWVREWGKEWGWHLLLILSSAHTTLDNSLKASPFLFLIPPPHFCLLFVYIHHTVLEITDSPSSPQLQEFSSPKSELEHPSTPGKQDLSKSATHIGLIGWAPALKTLVALKN